MFELISEAEQFEWFRAAYRHVTGEWLSRVRKSERPDYICRRADGSLVGIEFTLITHNPEASQWGQILDGKEYMDGLEGVLTVGHAIMRKGKKRAEPDWHLPDSSILVLSTADCPISEMDLQLDQGLQPEFEESGFTEIWIADHTEGEAYPSIELFGLVPKKWWGCHARPWTGKPYG